MQRRRLCRIFKPQLSAEICEKFCFCVCLLQLLCHARRNDILSTVKLLHRFIYLLRTLSHRLFLHAMPQCLRKLIHTFKQERIQTATFAVMHHSKCRIMRKGFFIAALIRQRIISIRNGNHLCRNGNIIPCQPVRIALAIPTLMVPATDHRGVFHQFFILIHRHSRNNLRTNHRMPFHNGKFLCGQLAGLCQNFLRNQQLPDIMQACRHANHIYIIRIQRIAVRPLHQTVQQKPRHTAYAGHVHPLFSAAQPQGIAQN